MQNRESTLCAVCDERLHIRRTCNECQRDVCQKCSVQIALPTVIMITTVSTITNSLYCAHYKVRLGVSQQSPVNKNCIK